MSHFVVRSIEWEYEVGCCHQKCLERALVTIRGIKGDSNCDTRKRLYEALAALGWHGYSTGWNDRHMCPIHGRSPGRHFRKIYGKGTRRK